MWNYVYLMLLIIGINKAEINPCDENSPFERITDFSEKDCKTGTFYHPKGNEKFHCLPKCFNKPDNDDIETYECDDDAENFKPCPPGYLCDKNEKKCTIDKDSCFKYHAEYKNGNVINKWYKAIWKPECLPDGTWKPKQCKGDSTSRRCFCFDSLGKRIFGQEFEKGESDMTCACSRKRLELTKTGSYFYATLHCDSNGNYESLQCNAGHCWCVKPTTGERISEVVPETMMYYLKCRHEKAVTIGEQYLRKCESEEYAQAKILYELRRHGTPHASFDFEHLMCDADGSYGAFSKRNGVATCKWRDNSNLNAGGNALSDLNCNCVRDEKIFGNVGLTHGKLCTQDGSYATVQQLSNGSFYCVDTDGYRKSLYLDKVSIDDCKEYL